MDKKAHILFTATFSTPFIREDLNILRSRHNITEFISSGIGTFPGLLFAIQKSDITFSWFASVYSSVLVLLGRIFGKRSIIIIGGVDVAKEREYNYGIWNSWWKSIIVRYGIINADIVLAVDESLKIEAMRLADYNGTNIQILPTGYDPIRWSPQGLKKKTVLSVGTANDLPRFKKKGFDILFSVASQMKDVEFVVIGISEEMRKQFTISENVRCFPEVSQDELLQYYRSSKVFCLLSRHEGLPNALCEAMLCECIPVGSNRFGIPNGIGDAGFVVEIGDIKEIVHGIRMALNSDAFAGQKARQRIISHFPLEKRKQQLLEIVGTLIQ